MAIQIYGIPLSVAVRRALVVFKELEVPYDLVTVDIIKGEQKSDKALKNQPFGKIPYLHDSDNDLTLFESRAIARYIVGKYDKSGKSGLLPTDEVDAARFEQAVSIEVTAFNPPANGVANELVFKPVLYKKETDQAKLVEALASLNDTLNVYETILSKQKYLAGEYLTLADLFHLPLGTVLTDMAKLNVLTTDKRPSVQRWWKDISSRPSWLVVKADTTPLVFTTE
ncbi:glutathione S-transferase [Cristinia sonorae]|uniref:glutathione transferase n=1 Tax=Cristinia sonorae TaxID=1940300 RepID=A0A8K0UJI8_9AGAR|nr:glutathione S-transferase [Cristinia sonorae]